MRTIQRYFEDIIIPFLFFSGVLGAVGWGFYYAYQRHGWDGVRSILDIVVDLIG